MILKLHPHRCAVVCHASLKRLQMRNSEQSCAQYRSAQTSYNVLPNVSTIDVYAYLKQNHCSGHTAMLTGTVLKGPVEPNRREKTLSTLHRAIFIGQVCCILHTAVGATPLTNTQPTGWAAR